MYLYNYKLTHIHSVMKIFKSLLIALLAAGTFASCQKELKFDDNGVSSGTLAKDGSGNCAPVTVNGIYKTDSVLNASNFVDVQVSVVFPGTFDIKSDTVNGYSFRKAGSVVFGANTIRLYATGKPIAAGRNIFTIKYGSSVCTFEVTAVPSNTSGAVYTIGGAPGVCTGAIAGGTYKAGVALDPNNTLTIQVNVTTVGYYTIGAATTNGFIFSGSGVFTTTGLQNVVLTGSGTPINAVPTAVTVTNLTATCSYSIAVLAGSGGGGGGTGNYYFQFNDGTTLVQADTATVISLAVPNPPMVALSVSAFSVTGDSSFSIAVTTTGMPVTGVTYNTNNIGVPLSIFNVLSTTNGQVYQADFSTLTKNIAIKFDVIDAVNKVVSGTFSGTANGIGGSTRTITNGKFKAKIP
jgi:hypothetical protein